MKTALVTGSAGFIGFHVAKRWLDQGWRVVGLDAFTDYYDPALKHARSDILKTHANYLEVRARIEDKGVLSDLFSEHKFEHVIHLAAQAGVRYSIDNPRSYVEANLIGTFELLEAARHNPGARLMLASTSSVFGANSKMPYAETDRADTQMSFYAATKKSTEAMAHSYSHLYDIPTTMFRFFTVYGPWGRPDMALFKFVEAILDDRPIDVYNHGKMRRDFTFVDDLVEAIWRLSDVSMQSTGCDLDQRAALGLSPVAPFRVVNIGKSQADELGAFIDQIELALGKKAIRNLMEMQPGDVPATWSDTQLLRDLTGYEAKTPLSHGIPKFVDWYREYFHV